MSKDKGRSNSNIHPLCLRSARKGTPVNGGPIHCCEGLELNTVRRESRSEQLVMLKDDDGA